MRLKNIFCYILVVLAWTAILQADSMRQIKAKDSTRVVKEEYRKLGISFTGKVWYSLGDVRVRRETNLGTRTEERYPLEEIYPILNLEYRPPAASFFSLNF